MRTTASDSETRTDGSEDTGWRNSDPSIRSALAEVIHPTDRKEDSMNGQEAYDLLRDYIRNSGFDPEDWDLDEARDMLMDRCGDMRPDDVPEDDIADVLMATDLDLGD